MRMESREAVVSKGGVPAGGSRSSNRLLQLLPLWTRRAE